MAAWIAPAVAAGASLLGSAINKFINIDKTKISVFCFTAKSPWCHLALYYQDRYSAK